MTDTFADTIVYYQITLALHVDLATERVRRVVELREEIHPREADPAMTMTDDGLIECAPDHAAEASRIAETVPWPGAWEFGY
jgi:hypothetical protein